MRKYTISTGRSRTELSWTRKEISWKDLCDRIAACRATEETVAEYKAMNKTQRGRIKDIGGFMGGSLRGQQRKASDVVMRSLVTLDIDYGRADSIENIGLVLDGTAWCLYSTHSHTPESPRYRLIVPLSRDVTPEEYVPVARRIASYIDIDTFDDSTYEPSRLMYWPSRCKDGDFVFRTGTGAEADPDRLLATYADWHNPIEWPVSSRISQLTQNHGAKQEDPRLKGGLIGAFCRTYSISDAIETFLADVYTPTDRADRYTYAEGSTAGGLVTYEDLWAYSHHGTDPAGQKLCNAFDLVRIHLFGSEDAEARPDTPINKMPSFVAMEKLICEDEQVSALRAVEAVDSLREEFAGIEPEEPADDSWKTQFRMQGKTNRLQSCPFNFDLIVRNDPKIAGHVVRDAFRGRDMVVGPLPWRTNTDKSPFWECSDDNGLIVYVSTVYQLEGKQALLDAMDLAVSQNSVHPVRDYLKALPKWDGTKRLDSILIDYLGAADDVLTRAMTRKHFVAAVARVMKPGCKYDNILTLVGPEGIGKSTLIKLLGREWFNDSLTSIEGKEAMEQLRGTWLAEMGELTNYKRSTSDAYKAFISKQEDTFRPAYGRRTEIYPRQCVFFATTNEKNFLKGDTGNRRFWTVDCATDICVKDVWEQLPGEVDQIWAEALAAYKAHETLYLPHKLEMMARERQAQNNELESDERRGRIEAFLDQPIPDSWDTMNIKQRQEYYNNSSPLTLDPSSTKLREGICAVEILVECFGERWDDKTRYRTKEINQILRRMPELEDPKITRIAVYGPQRVYRIKRDDQL